MSIEALKRQAASVISTYSADVFGVCSALFELGGMVVMHDPSGCNSTYTTHDEPRWYDTDSMIYISALTETEAIMGDDEKLIRDICETAALLKPTFIAVAGTPVPMLMGTDFAALAAVIERGTGITAFGFPTDGMKSYISGASMAFAALAEKMTVKTEKTPFPSANILGLTPLDFSVNSSAESIKRFLTDNGFCVLSSWAMGGRLSDIARAGGAHVNLVVSQSGIAAAQVLERKFGTPYVAGVPIRKGFSAEAARALKVGETAVAYDGGLGKNAPVVIIGEGVYSASLAASLTMSGVPARVICPLELTAATDGIERISDEAGIKTALDGAVTVIADPLYKPICPEGARFVPLPHEAFSGRIYRREIPDLIGNEDYINAIRKEV